ncbi:MAG: phosphotransferase, partial [Gammaproteobacteria bacterium]
MSLAPLTVSDATAIIARRCAGWCVESIEFLGEGDFCAGFLVNRDWVFRFAKHEKAAASLNREARLLPQIARQFDVMIPSPEFGGFEDTPAFIAYRALPGLALTQDRYLQLSESDRDRCAFQVGVFLRQMHATDLKLARSSGLEHADYAAHFDGLSKQVAQALWSKL